jgi:hypothetical protein
LNASPVRLLWKAQNCIASANIVSRCQILDRSHRVSVEVFPRLLERWNHCWG